MQPPWPIETERLVLRPYEEGDFDALHAIYADLDVTRWLYYGASTPEESRERLGRKIASRVLTAEQGLAAAVVLRDGTFVGDLVLWYSSPAEHRSAELGFSFDPRHHGNGYATEAARAIVGWALANGVHRVHGRAEVRNVASVRVLEKLGMRKEAHFVENEWVKDEWSSEVVYAILDREWR